MSSDDVATTSLPVKAAAPAWEVRRSVANVESVENSTRAVVVSDSGLTLNLTKAPVLLMPSRFTKSTFGA